MQCFLSLHFIEMTICVIRRSDVPSAKKLRFHDHLTLEVLSTSQPWLRLAAHGRKLNA
jgi:hypothetical protein